MYILPYIFMMYDVCVRLYLYALVALAFFWVHTVSVWMLLAGMVSSAY